MSATLAIIWFLLGSGLLGLGAFFIRRWTGHFGGWWAVLATVLPATVVALIAAINGQTEMAVGMIWGTVAVNLGFIGILSLGFNVRPTRQAGLSNLLWLAFGLGGCLVAGRSGNLGMFSGWGLVAVGLIALWQWIRQPNVDAAEYQTPSRAWWQWLCCAVAVLGVIVGAWLMVARQTVIGAVLGLPPSVCAAAVIAPIIGLIGWTGIRQNKQWQPAKLLHGWLGANVLLATLVLGLAAVLSGGLRLTQSTVAVTLPWVTGMAVLSAVVLFLPKKTAHWWGGLIAFMYVAYLISLFW